VGERTDQVATLRLKLDGFGPTGEAVAESDGMTVHVFGGIPGEEVLAAVVRRHRKHVAARVAGVVAASPWRIEQPCPYFGECTGCQWQHVAYERQLEIKRQLLAEALAAGAGVEERLVAPPDPAPETFGYRNHARFTVGPEGLLGFVNRDTHRFVRVDRCLLMHPWINQALPQLQGRCGQTTQVSIRYGVNTGSWVVQPALGPSIPLESGQTHYEERLLGSRFRIHNASFFQVNTLQAEKMAELIIERLSLTGREMIVDAYAGVGTFAVLLAPHADRIFAIEDSAIAVRDARANCNGLGNVEILTARTEDILTSLPYQTDAVVLDPPRVGCHPAALRALMKRPPHRLVYVSCDPRALARDLRILLDGPFVLREVLPLDLFPHTHHIECVATLALDEGKQWSFERRQKLVLASESPRRQEIMRDMGLEFEVVPSQVREAPPASADPAAIAEARALQKARAVASALDEGTVVGADTVVVLDGEILGKPVSEEEAGLFLRRLRGKEHSVITGLAVVDAAGGVEVVGHRRSRVHMRAYTDEEIEEYVATGDPLDKAGAYAVQDARFKPADRVRGCYLNVVGLPPCTLMDLLHRLGVYPGIDPRWKPPGNCQECRHLAAGGGGRRH